ncbi:UNVERIFIED_CONTAM: hypothetical protein Scaly_2766600 [Sesamum calycinum]|uniref:Reverse transcriptase domain-containing protein n=1 Tax=Sesamum calycinum TaxID=2727403 RepID=A0AAW2J119_9LAMI
MGLGGGLQGRHDGGSFGGGGGYQSLARGGRKGPAIFDASRGDGDRGCEKSWNKGDTIGEGRLAIVSMVRATGGEVTRFLDVRSANRGSADVGGETRTSLRRVNEMAGLQEFNVDGLQNENKDGSQEENEGGSRKEMWQSSVTNTGCKLELLKRKIAHSLGKPQVKFCLSSQAGRFLGGLALLWSKEVVVQLRSFSNNHMDADILDEMSMTNWRFTGFYEEPEEIFMSSTPSNLELNEVLSLVQPRVTTEMKPSTYSTIHCGRCKNSYIRKAASNAKPIGLDQCLIPFYRNLNPFLFKSQGRCVALKLEMSKGFDKVEWAFLQGVLLRLGIFSPERGIRQGDPLSPYLFLFCVEAFSCLIQDAERRGQLTGVAVARQELRMSHLLYADDTLVFCKATMEQISEVGRILRQYAWASDQEISLQHFSMVVNGGVLEVVKYFLGALLGVQVVSCHDKYLGLPTVGGQSWRSLFKNIRDRLRERIEGWNTKMLLQAGKGVLVKAVLQSLPTYGMSCFQMPMGLVPELESLMADFWCHSRGDKRVHWIAWRKLCRTPAKGGLGFCELRAFNMALLAKQGWRILIRLESLLSRVLKPNYFPTSSFAEAEVGPDHHKFGWVFGKQSMWWQRGVGKMKKGCGDDAMKGWDVSLLRVLINR